MQLKFCQRNKEKKPLLLQGMHHISCQIRGGSEVQPPEAVPRPEPQELHDQPVDACMELLNKYVQFVKCDGLLKEV